MEKAIYEDGSEHGFTMFERLTDTYLQTVAAIINSNDSKDISTFLDDDIYVHWYNCQPDYVFN